MAGLELKCGQCGGALHIFSVRSGISVSPCRECYGNLFIAVRSLDTAIGDFKRLSKQPLVNMEGENVNATLSVLKKDAFLMKLLDDVRSEAVDPKEALYKLLNYTEPME